MSADLQAKANALNTRMEGAARTAIDDVERSLLRPLARQSYACVVDCYDKAAKTNWGSPQLDNCSRQCQGKYQRAHATVNEEVNQFQNRLSRAMMQCNDDANVMMTPDIQNNPAKMKKLEETTLHCISKTVDNHIGYLEPMKQRISSQLKKL